jgi:hypothetical protein
MTDNLDIGMAYRSGLKSALVLLDGATDCCMSIKMTRSKETKLVLLPQRSHTMLDSKNIHTYASVGLLP